MHSIVINNLDDLKKHDLPNFEVVEDLSVKIRLNLNNAKVEYPIYIYHKKPNLKSNIDIKITALNGSFVDIVSKVEIQKNAIDSTTAFKSVVFLLSPNNRINVVPQLKIDEKNIKSASHSLVVKNIKDKDLYYLVSGGMSFEEARDMIIKSVK